MSEVTVYVVDYGRTHFYMRYTDPETGKEVTRTTRKKTRRDAEKVAAQWEADINSGRYSAVEATPWSVFCEKFNSQYLSGLKPSTRSKFFTLIDQINSRKPPSEIGKINTIFVTEFLSNLRSDESINSESTIASYRGHLRAMTNWAFDQGYLIKKPIFKRVRRASKSAGTPMKGRPLTDEELEKIIAAVPAVLSRLERGTGATNSTGKQKANRGINVNPADWIFYLKAMNLSGLRLEESLDFWWDREDKLHLHNGMMRIHAEDEKGNRDRLLPLTPDFVEFLNAVPESERTGRVFKICPDFKTAKDTVGKIVGNFGKESGVIVNARTGKHASIHDFRRTFGERWAMRVMPHTLMQLMRHESIETTMRFYAGRNALKVMEELARLSREDERKTADSGNTFGNTPGFRFCPHCGKSLLE